MEGYLKELIQKLIKYEGVIFWAFMFGIIHTVFSDRNKSFLAYVLALITCIPVGVLSGIVATESFGLSQSEAFVIVSISSLLAQDIVKFILGLSGFINTNKEVLFYTLLEFLKKKFKIKNHKKKD